MTPREPSLLFVFYSALMALRLFINDFSVHAKGDVEGGVDHGHKAHVAGVLTWITVSWPVW